MAVFSLVGVSFLGGRVELSGLWLGFCWCW